MGRFDFFLLEFSWGWLDRNDRANVSRQNVDVDPQTPRRSQFSITPTDMNTRALTLAYGISFFRGFF